MSIVLPYTLAGASLLSTFIVTILNGISYATSKASSDLAPLVLSSVSCLALVILSVLHHKDIQGRLQWTCITGGYLLIASAISAGAMTSSPQASVFVTRAVFWAFAVFAQGLYSGFIAMPLFHERQNPEWPRSYPEELKSVPQSPHILPSPPRVCDLSELFEPKRTSLRKFPRRSNRFSDATLCQSTKETKRASIDTSSTRSTPTHSPTTDKTPFEPSHSLPLRGNNSIRSMPSLRRNPPTHLSLDSLVQRSPTGSTLHLDSPTLSTLSTATLPPAPTSAHSTWEYNPFQDTNIHPLFRSTSPAPSPTTAPGTMLKASPSAGQTLTKGTITRMRSARSLREQCMRTPSPMRGVELDELPRVRKDPALGSFTTSQSERYELNESPYEK
jgi:hypothetical protein